MRHTLPVQKSRVSCATVAAASLVASVLLTHAAGAQAASRAAAGPVTNASTNTASSPSAANAASNMAQGEAAYAKTAKLWSSLRSVHANFDQRITNPLLNRTVTSKGSFLQQRPGKVNITFTDPVGDRIVGDGTFLWVYLPSSTPGQVLKLPANADGAVVTDLLGQLLDQPSRTFVIGGGEAVAIDGKSTRRVALTPRVAGSVAFQRAVLWLDETDGRPIRVQVIDPQGVDRTITLTSWSPNASVPKDAFRFSVPRGAKVVTKLPS